jgi:hypothetical protein
MQISFVIEANAFIREDEFLSGGRRKIKRYVASEQPFAAYSLHTNRPVVLEACEKHLRPFCQICPDAEIQRGPDLMVAAKLLSESEYA